jgi:formamidopyrimidine-DNA glycosylase
MIELPESACLAQQFAVMLKGKTVSNVQVNKSPHKFAWFHGNPEDYHTRLSGRTVTGADSFGGMAEVQFDELKLVVFDGTNVRYYGESDRLPVKHQLHIEFDDFTSITCSVHKFGIYWCLFTD